MSDRLEKYLHRLRSELTKKGFSDEDVSALLLREGSLISIFYHAKGDAKGLAKFFLSERERETERMSKLAQFYQRRITELEGA